MATLQRTQDPSDILDWTFDYTEDLAENGGTIASAVATTDVAGAVTSNTTPASPIVTTRLTCTGVPAGTLVALTCQVTLSTGEKQSKTHHITIEDT